MSRASIEKEKELEEELNGAMKTYYKLKNDYENKRYENKKQIINNTALSWKEKRNAFQKLAPKCINCDRPVGTVFSMKYVDLEHHLIALCGDKKEPCPLNIDINKGITIDNYTFAVDDEKTIADLKTQIIIDKNDLLFGYISAEHAINKFDAIKEQLKELTQNYEISIQNYYSIVDNSEKKEEISKIRNELSVNISALQHTMHEYDKSQNVQLVHDVIELYINEIMPKLKKIMNDTYSYYQVEVEPISNIESNYILVQKQYTIQDLEWNLGTPSVHMKMGNNSGTILKKGKKIKEISALTSGLIPDIDKKNAKLQLKPESVEKSKEPSKSKKNSASSIHKKLVILDEKSSEEAITPIELLDNIEENDEENDEEKYEEKDEEKQWETDRL